MWRSGRPQQQRHQAQGHQLDARWQHTPLASPALGRRGPSWCCRAASEPGSGGVGTPAAAPRPPQLPDTPGPTPPATTAINVTLVAPPPVAPPPEPLAVMHSGAFMRSRRRTQVPSSSSTSSSASSDSGELPAAPPAPEPSSSAAQLGAPAGAGELQPVDGRPGGAAAADNALMWALAKVDRQLDAIEAAPPPLLKAGYDAAHSPLGEAAGRGVQAAARLTVEAATGAVKAAAPVGAWALREGIKVAGRAALGLAALAAEQQQKKAQRERGSGGKGDKR